MILFSNLASVSQGSIKQLREDREIRSILTDSRKSAQPDSCFVAIRGARHDGHEYIDALYHSGVRMFIVEKQIPYTNFPDANFFLAASSLTTLRDLAAHHRSQFNYPVIGVTGSNGKTIVKEWIYQLLAPLYSIVKNPGSYNSQLGVPLSVLKMQAHHELGVFEAGISMPGEMILLQRIIQPTIGIFTNIGSSHDAGFSDRAQKVREKLLLFRQSKVLIYCRDYDDIHKEVELLTNNIQVLDWGESSSASVHLERDEAGTLQISFEGEKHSFTAPFFDDASSENLIHCIVLMLHLGIGSSIIQEGINSLKSVPMRLELKQGVNQSLIIDDTYNNDLAGLQISLDFLAGQQKQKKLLILSDVLQSGLKDDDLVKEIAGMVLRAGVNSFTGIGSALTKYQRYFNGIDAAFYNDTEVFLNDLDTDLFQNTVVLVKGARSFHFESIVQRLQRKVHGTVMEIDLSCVVHNLNYFKSRLKPGVKLMVMVKAFAYGSGSEEVANLLQYHQVDYLGVAYADEGIELRKNRITLPIMVMNPSEESFPALLEYNLEPEIYSLKILRAFVRFLGRRSCKVHIKFDTGMHRLGFEEQDMSELISILKSHPGILIASVFSHLAGSDEAEHDAFSKEQVSIFNARYEQLSTSLQQRPVRHVLNSPGILRFPEFQFEMVRLGIGLYGVDPTDEKKADLQPVATLKTVISQVRKVPAGQSIGYGRKGRAANDMVIATIAIGYADGFSRAFSRGVGVVLVNGKRAPVVGNVCMDMTMVDVTGMEANEGDEVIIFGKDLPIGEVAERIKTIPYEILTSTSERVKRVFHAESI
jgi:alanine racemase